MFLAKQKHMLQQTQDMLHDPNVARLLLPLVSGLESECRRMVLKALEMNPADNPCKSPDEDRGAAA